MGEQLSPREFLRTVDFLPERVSVRYPHAEGHLLGALFVSHSGVDFERIREVIAPVVYGRLGPNGYFLHSRMSGGAQDYRQLVQAALHWCDKFMLVLSRTSMSNEWVQAEAVWALERSRPMLIARFDDSSWTDFRQALPLARSSSSSGSIETFDFGADPQRAAHDLAAALDLLLEKSPYLPTQHWPVKAWPSG